MQGHHWLARGVAALAIVLTACGGGSSVSGSATSNAQPLSGSATASNASATAAASAISSLPASNAHGIVIDTGLTDPQTFVFPAPAVVAAGKLWFGGPKGLVQIDPATNAASIVDREPGASLSVMGNVLWRGAYQDNTIRRYELDSMQRLADLQVPHPLYLLATESGIWVSEHHEGFLAKLDPDTGVTVATTAVTTPAGPGAAGLVERDGRLFVVITKDGTIVEIDPATATVVDTHQLPTVCDGLNYVAGAFWSCWLGGSDPEEMAAEEIDRSLFVQRIDPTTFASRKVTLGVHPGLPGEVDGEAWIPVGDTLVKLDSSTGEPVRVVRLNLDGFDGAFVIEAFGSVWVYGKYDVRVVRLDPEDLR